MLTTRSAFITQNYATLKKANPDLPLLVREANGTPARIFARFERGVERHVEVRAGGSLSHLCELNWPLSTLSGRRAKRDRSPRRSWSTYRAAMIGHVTQR